MQRIDACSRILLLIRTGQFDIEVGIEQQIFYLHEQKNDDCLDRCWLDGIEITESKKTRLSHRRKIANRNGNRRRQERAKSIIDSRVQPLCTM
jgi:hypothetical protein